METDRVYIKNIYAIFTEAGHPLKPDIQRQLYLDQSNISHRVNEVWWEGNILKGYGRIIFIIEKEIFILLNSIII